MPFPFLCSPTLFVPFLYSSSLLPLSFAVQSRSVLPCPASPACLTCYLNLNWESGGVLQDPRHRVTCLTLPHLSTTSSHLTTASPRLTLPHTPAFLVLQSLSPRHSLPFTPRPVIRGASQPCVIGVWAVFYKVISVATETTRFVR